LGQYVSQRLYGYRVVEFLADRGVFGALTDIRATVERFRQGALPYEEFCRRMADAYASALAGQAQSAISATASSFVASDSRELFSFVSPLCSYLAEQNVRVIVVSGAPEEPLKQYANAIGFELGGALRLKIENGCYTGGISENCGLGGEKEAAVRRLALSREVAAAMGASTSDLPLLEAAPVGFVVLGAIHNSVPSGPNFVPFNSGIDPTALLQSVKRHLAANSRR